MFDFRATVLTLALSVACATAAEPLPPPRGDVVLTVTGAIGETNRPGAAEFDLEMLRSLGEVTLVTSTIWTEGPQQFRGVPLRAVLDRVGAAGSLIEASALNDYLIEIPASDAVAGGPIIAFEQNGMPLSVRDKGPLWVIYPYDADEAWRSEVIFARSIWQLTDLDVLP